MLSTFSRSSLATAMALLAAVAGCGESDSGGDSEAKYTIGFSQCNLGEPWRVQMNKDVEAAAEKYPDIEVRFKDAQNDSLRQRAHVEEFITAGVDLIIISPKEAIPLTEPVGKAMDAGIPVIVLDRAIVGDKYTCFVGVDNKMIARRAGEWLIEKLGGEGRIVELKGLMTSIPGQERHDGFRQALKGHPGMDVIFEADMKWLEPDARKEMESALARFDDIDAVYAHNDPGAHGAHVAAKEAGREKDMLFVGIDALPHEGIAYVKQGILDISFLNPTGGAEVIDRAVDILAGKEVPKNITLKSRCFTKENVDQGGEPLD